MNNILVDLSRWQFAITIASHMTFPAITVGMSVFLVMMYGSYLRTRKEIYLAIYRFWPRGSNGHCNDVSIRPQLEWLFHGGGPDFGRNARHGGHHRLLPRGRVPWYYALRAGPRQRPPRMDLKPESSRSFPVHQDLGPQFQQAVHLLAD